MFSQYFGHFLLNHQLLTLKQLEQALEAQKNAHVKLGVLSVNAGYMTASQATEVHQKQTQLDKRFGEIAIDLGYLTNEQLDSLLSEQKYSHLLLGQVLIDAGIMTLEQFSEALDAYKAAHSLSDEQFQAIQQGDTDALIQTLLQSDLANRMPFLQEYFSLFAKNMIRFIDEQIRLEIMPLGQALQNDWIVSQEIHGETPVFSAIVADDATLVELAKRYAQEELTEPDELAQASLSELLNLHNGIFLVNMSNRGIELDMKPQHIVQQGMIESVNDGVACTVHLPNHSFTLYVSAKTPPIAKV